MEFGDPKVLDQFQSIFSDLFGMGNVETADVRLALSISLREAAHGAERIVEHKRSSKCKACRGTGGAPGARFQECPSCDGKGSTEIERGAFRLATTCERCKGTGGEWPQRCASCDGLKKQERPGKWTVTIPPGVAAGHVLKLAGQGNDLGEGPGDLLIELTVEPHPSLRRRGDDLCARMTVSPELAERGGELAVAWLEGDAILRVPPGSTHGTRLTQKGWGVVRFGEPFTPPPPPGSPYRSADAPGRGDLVVTLHTHEPEPIDPRAVLGLGSSANRTEIDEAYRRSIEGIVPSALTDERLTDIELAYEKLKADEARLEQALLQQEIAGPVDRAPPSAGKVWLVGIALTLAAFVYVLLSRL